MARKGDKTRKIHRGGSRIRMNKLGDLIEHLQELKEEHGKDMRVGIAIDDSYAGLKEVRFMNNMADVGGPQGSRIVLIGY